MRVTRGRRLDARAQQSSMHGSACPAPTRSDDLSEHRDDLRIEGPRQQGTHNPVLSSYDEGQRTLDP